MIKAAPGNILKSIRTGGYVVVDWLVIKHLSDGNIQSVYDPTPVYEPVELTEEILLKCGFIKQDFDELEYLELPFDRPNISIYTGDKNGFLEVVITCDDTELIRTRHLHILQNWYYLLLGNQELIINL